MFSSNTLHPDRFFPAGLFRIASIAFGLAVGTSHATTLNFDVNGADGANYSGTAVAPNEGTVWNSFLFEGDTSSHPLRRLRDSQGNLYPDGQAILKDANENNVQVESETSSGNPNPALLMGDYAHGGTFEAAVGGLEPGDYVLYVFAHGAGATDTSTVTVNDANGGMTGTTGSAGSDYRNLFAAGAEGNAYLKFDGVSVGDDGILQFVVEGFVNGFQLIHKEPASIQSQPPENLTGYAEFGISIPVVASGPESTTFQWQKSTDGGASFEDLDPGILPSTATDTLEFSSLRFDDSGIYRVVVSTPFETLVSDSTVLTVEEYLPPFFTMDPEGEYVSVNGSVTFHAEMLKVEGVSFQWFKDGEPIEGATDSSYSITGIDFSDAGSYTVEARNDHGTVMSEAAVLFVFGGLPAFPGAEGFGAIATGGRGGDVYHVTSLEDTDTQGTLRHAIDTAPASGRTIVFDIAGDIHLNDSLTVHRPNITIAGQTAPGKGITLSGGTLWLESDNLIVRHIRTRLGANPVDGEDAISIKDGSRVIIDHSSGSWSTDEAMSVTQHSTNNTIQWSLITEPLDSQNHSRSSLFRPGAETPADTPTRFNLSVHHSLYAHGSDRNPVMSTYNGHTLRIDFRNNVVFDWRNQASHSGDIGQFVELNFVSNYYVAGLSTRADIVADPSIFASGSPDTTIYHNEDNLVDVTRDDGLHNGVFDPSSINGERTDTPFEVPPVVTQSAADAYEAVLDHAGAFWWNRDPVDERVTTDVREISSPDPGVRAQSGGVLVTEADAGGLPTLPVEVRPANWDTDGDGMPDTWEEKHGLDPYVPDHNGDFDGDHYTNLEEYINAAGAFPSPVDIVFDAGQNTRFARAENWSANWQPSRFDTAVISGRTVVVDAPGQQVGTLELSDGATLGIESGWLEASSIEIGAGSSVTITHPGMLRLAGSGAITLADGATFINSGTLDITDWEGTLPEGFVNNGTVLDETSERWGSYYILKDGWTNTGNFLGWIHVAAAPWLYVYPVEQWMYCAEEWLVEGVGSWVFAPEMARGSSADADAWLGYAVGEDGWIESTPLGGIYPDGNHAWLEQLGTWVYFPALNSETPISWMFVFDRNR